MELLVTIPSYSRHYKRAVFNFSCPKIFEVLNGALHSFFSAQIVEIPGFQQTPTMFYDFRPLVPLSLDGALYGKHITSSLPIFRLPVELLSHLVPYLSPADIRCLAFVDRDARQLSRTLQFAHVELDYGSCSLDLLAMLKHEVNDLQDTEYRLGTCIRRLTVRNPRTYVSSRENFDLHDFRGLTIQEVKEPIDTARLTKAAYLHLICSLLPHLPNLHILDWRDEEPLTPDMLGCMMSSSIVHLRLDGPTVDPVFALAPSAGRINWPLESLSINIGWLFTSSNAGDVAFISSLMRLTAPTLQSLTWSGFAGQLMWGFPPHADLHFDVLREINLEHIMLRDPTVLNMIICMNTHIRSISVDSNLIVSQFLLHRGHIPSLNRLRWDRSYLESHDELIEFVHSNTQLACLEVTSPLSPSIMKSIILDHDRQVLDNLTTLHFVLEGRDFPEDSLATIASISSLKHLWLSAGTQDGMQHDWVVNHDVLEEALRPLSRLETLVLTRDTYVVDVHPLLDSSAERYYINKILPCGLSLTDYLTEDEMQKMDCPDIHIDDALRLRSLLSRLAWERWHVSQMVSLATRYVERLMNLKWCFIGQLPIRVEDIQSYSVGCLLIKERDHMLKSLHVYWNAILA